MDVILEKAGKRYWEKYKQERYVSTIIKNVEKLTDNNKQKILLIINGNK